MPQRGCRREYFCAFSGVSGSPASKRRDRLVLGAVVLEHAPQVAASARAATGSRGRSPVRRIPSTIQNRKAEPSWSLKISEADRHDEEQADRERERGDHGADPHAARDRLLVLGQLRVGGDAERLEADLQRLASATTPRMIGQRQHAVASSTRRAGTTGRRSRRARPRPWQALLAELLGQRLADRDGPRARRRASSRPRGPPDRLRARPSAPSGRRLAGGSRAWTLGWLARCRRERGVAARRWKRSTRPPVSTSFCLPV